MTPATALRTQSISRLLARSLVLVGAVCGYLLLAPPMAEGIELPPVTEGLGNAVDGVTETVEVVTGSVDEVTTTATEAVEEVTTTATEGVEEVTSTTTGLVEQAIEVVDVTPVTELVSNLGHVVTEAATGLVEPVTETVAATTSRLNTVVEVVGETVSATVGTVEEVVSPLLGEAASTIDDVVAAAVIPNTEVHAVTAAAPASPVVVNRLLEEEPLPLQVIIPPVATASLAPVSVSSPSTPGAVPGGFSFAQPVALPAAATASSEGWRTGTQATSSTLPPVQHGIGEAGGRGLTQTAAVLTAFLLLGLGISRWLRLLSDARPLNPFALPIAQPG